jgi:hypothetical protein
VALVEETECVHCHGKRDANSVFFKQQKWSRNTKFEPEWPILLNQWQVRWSGAWPAVLHAAPEKSKGWVIQGGRGKLLVERTAT